MNWRMRELRRLLGLTEKEWAAAIGQARAEAAAAGHPYSEDLEGSIRLICNTFHVNEVWIRHGTGPVLQSGQ